MVESLLKFVTSQSLFSHDDKLLLAVSGGVDSMVMAQLFANAGIEFSIAHVNYNLRGRHSIGDKDFVKNWADCNHVPVYVREVQEDEYEISGSIQVRAREIRYTFFQSLMSERGYTKVATAHHLNDAFETIMLNLVRGSGPRGLKGIPIKRDEIIRPMMFASREDIMNYAKTYNIKWREDASNSKIDYHRNFIRKEIAPRLKELNPSLENTFKDTLLRLEATSELVVARKQEILNQYVKEGQGVKVIVTDWVQDDKISLLILSEILSDYGLNFKVCKDVHACVLSNKVGKMFYGADVEINVDRDSLIVKASENERVAMRIGVEQEEINLCGQSLSLERLTEHWEISVDLSKALLNYESLQWPLTLRTWEKGDRFTPFGMKGSKLVSDFLIDNKVPVSLKSKVLVLISGGEICWVMGYRISDKFKVTKQTNSVLKMTISHA